MQLDVVIMTAITINTIQYYFGIPRMTLKMVPSKIFLEKTTKGSFYFLNLSKVEKTITHILYRP